MAVHDRIDRAIDQVLAAEGEARAAVAQCHAEAQRILATAQESAHRIAQRTEGRIGLAHRIADQAVDVALAKLDAPQSQSEPAPATGGDGMVSDVLEKAVDALVDEILQGHG